MKGVIILMLFWDKCIMYYLVRLILYKTLFVDISLPRDYRWKLAQVLQPGIMHLSISKVNVYFTLSLFKKKTKQKNCLRLLIRHSSIFWLCT